MSDDIVWNRVNFPAARVVMVESIVYIVSSSRAGKGNDVRRCILQCSTVPGRAGRQCQTIARAEFHCFRVGTGTMSDDVSCNDLMFSAARRRWRRRILSPVWPPVENIASDQGGAPNQMGCDVRRRRLDRLLCEPSRKHRLGAWVRQKE